MKKSSIFYPKILVATPTAEIKDYCWDEFYERVKNLSYPNYDFFVADNTIGRKHLKMLRKQGVDVGEVKPKNKSNIQYLCESHNLIRDKFLKGGYRKLLHLESDVIPPSDIIQRLLACDKDVVSAMYFIAFGQKSHLMLIEQDKNSLSTMDTMTIEDGKDFNIVDGQLHQIHNAGLGCTMISRKVMRKIKFRYEQSVYAHPDTFLIYTLLSIQKIKNLTFLFQFYYNFKFLYLLPLFYFFKNVKIF